MNSTLTSPEYNSDSLTDPVSISEGSDRMEEDHNLHSKNVGKKEGTLRPPAHLAASTGSMAEGGLQQPTVRMTDYSTDTHETADSSYMEDLDQKQKARAAGDRRDPLKPPPATVVGATAVGATAVGSKTDKKDDTTAANTERSQREAAKLQAYAGDGTTKAGAVAIDEKLPPPADVEEGAPPPADEGEPAKPPAVEKPSSADDDDDDHAVEEEDLSLSGIVPDVVNAAPADAVLADSKRSLDEARELSPAPLMPFPPQDLPEATPVPDQTALPPQASMAGGDEEAALGGVSVAQPIDQDPLPVERRKRVCGNCLSPTQWAVGALLIVVLIVVGVVVAVTQKKCSDAADAQGKCGGDATDDAPGTMAPSEEGSGNSVVTLPPTDPINCVPFESFNNDLHFLTLQALKEPCSPQSRANAWMMQDPNLDVYGVERKLQRFALATLYYSTSGDQWKNNHLWLDYEHDECQWYNQDADGEDPVCNEDFSIVHLNLSRNSLNGVLPVELFFFPALATLDLSHNRLYGTAPTMFNGARYLERLVLSSNQLTGQFTAELGFVASKLAVLHNDDNMFTGAVPGLLRLLPNLSHLNITGNQYTGSLPGSLSQLSNTLTSLEVSENAITGNIPTELGAATKLQVLDVGGNAQMSGSVPEELAALSDLTIFDISGTSISGGLATELCQLQSEGQLEVLADCGIFQCCPV